MALPIALAWFVLVLSIFWGLYWAVVLRREAKDAGSMARRMRSTVTPVRVPLASVVAPVRPLSSFGRLARLLARATWIVTRAQTLITRSGLRVTVGQLVLASVFAALAGFTAVVVATGIWWFAAVIALLSAAAPAGVLRIVGARRLAKFEEQFPEAIDLMARALRAGHAMTAGLTMVADEMPPPVADEFVLLRDRQSFGMPLDVALREFADAVPLLDARFFVTALLTQRESGGNLSEVLDKLSALMRERFRIRRQVRVLSAHGRITGWVLAALAPALAVMLTVIAPDHIASLFTDPLGRRMVAGAIVLQIIGVFTMRRIVAIEM